MRNRIIAVAVLAQLVALVLPATGQPLPAPGIEILDAGMVKGHVLRVEIAAEGIDTAGAEAPDVSLEAWLDGTHVQASLLLIRMPGRFAMDLDLPAGAVRVGEVKIGEFTPVAPFADNMRFPIRVTLHDRAHSATATRVVSVLLPTVIVPGYMNELGGRSEDTVAALLRHGYRDGGPAPTVFWFGYPSHLVTLESGGRRLAEYVRRAVLPQTYAAKINVLAYSLGGLMARWNVQFNVDGWASLVNRLMLVGVPNEGTILAYTYRNMPTFLPYAYFAHAPAAQEMAPTFPFWRGAPEEAWTLPGDAKNGMLAALNAQPMPEGVRVWVFYGSGRAGEGNTMAGMTQHPKSADLGPGDGIVLAASAEGLPIHSRSGIAALLGPDVVRVDLGSIAHGDLLTAGAERFADGLMDRVRDADLRAAAGR